jgi:hypothetical protein
LNFIAKYFGAEEALQPHWDFLRAFVRGETGKIKYRVIENPFPDGQDSDVLTIIRSSITIRIENCGGNIVGSLQFYGNHIYQYVLRENAALPYNLQFGYCYIGGEKPMFLTMGQAP